MSTQTAERTGTTVVEVLEPTTGEPIFKHIVAPKGNKSASALIMEAMVKGIPVTAICGHTWVPSRKPENYPLCSKCREIREHFRPDENPEDIPT
jgi:hypothetical protein